MKGRTTLLIASRASHFVGGLMTEWHNVIVPKAQKVQSVNKQTYVQNLVFLV